MAGNRIMMIEFGLWPGPPSFQSAQWLRRFLSRRTAKLIGNDLPSRGRASRPEGGGSASRPAQGGDRDDPAQRLTPAQARSSTRPENWASDPCGVGSASVGEKERLRGGRTLTGSGEGGLPCWATASTNAPALRRASVGIAMGLPVTDIARGKSADATAARGTDLGKFVESAPHRPPMPPDHHDQFRGNACLVDAAGVALAAFGFLNPVARRDHSR